MDVDPRWKKALKFALIIMLCSFTITLPGCEDKDKTTGPDEQDDPEVDEVTLTLLPESSLTSGCVNWPAENFSQGNRAGGLTTSVVKGQSAIEFTLQDLDGTSYSLSSLLKTKPVFLIFGSFT